MVAIGCRQDLTLSVYGMIVAARKMTDLYFSGNSIQEICEIAEKLATGDYSRGLQVMQELICQCLTMMVTSQKSGTLYQIIFQFNMIAAQPISQHIV